MLTKLSMTALVCCLCAGSIALAADSSPLAAFDFWAGHCWKGSFPDGKSVDEHCFAWVYPGHALRDRHVVTAPGRPDYIGETVYFWDSEAKAIAYVYYENLGGIGRGTAVATAEGLSFPDGRYSGAGQVLVYRATWKKGADGSYQAANEARKGEDWVPTWTIAYKVSGPAK